MYIHVPQFPQILMEFAIDIKEKKGGKNKKKKTTFHKPSAALGMNLFMAAWKAPTS